MFCQSSSKIGMLLGTRFVKRENNISSNKFKAIQARYVQNGDFQFSQVATTAVPTSL